MSAMIGASIVPLTRNPAGASTTWNTGDVFVGLPGHVYNVYDSAGNFKETITGSGDFGTGCSFNPAGDRLYTTNFAGAVIAFDNADPHAVVQTITTGKVRPESLVFAADGRFFVGGPDDTLLEEYDAAGNLLDSDTVTVTDARPGPDWVELAADQHTIYFTSESSTIFRYGPLIRS